MDTFTEAQHIRDFIRDWTGHGYEKGESQKFWMDILSRVLGVAVPAAVIEFEDRTALDHTSFIDAYIPATHTLIEQKSLGKSLTEPILQSDGTRLTPAQQAKRYSDSLPYSRRARWIVTCNFESFHIYDMERPQDDPEIILLKDLEKDAHRLRFLITGAALPTDPEIENSLEAGELVGKLYDALHKQYKRPDDPESLKSLNILCVRLVFCFWAEDAGIFGRKKMFTEYLTGFLPKNMRMALIELFKTLDTKEEDRDEYMDETLAAFPYVNGGLFKDEKIEIPQFDEEIRALMLHDSVSDFDWSKISPTIFGAVFESTLNPETRRSGGMHYTSIANIHKVIDPLFLDALREELRAAKEIKIFARKKAALQKFQQKLAGLTFLDPACGSGNFLTETYLSLRRLENEAIWEIQKDQGLLALDGMNPVRVSINQFYGIEINDFAATVAKTALWISEEQMLRETEKIIQAPLDFLPLKSYVNIVEGNALRLDWETVVPKEKLSYIMGNPPFVGARLMDKAQKADVIHVFGQDWKNSGNLDYVTCWYKLCADIMEGNEIRTALVSTNSVCQGDAVATLWKNLFCAGVHIDFAHRTFRWDSESNSKAHVHCVIVGFSCAKNDAPKEIYSGNKKQQASFINAYLLDAAPVFAESRTKPICDVPEIGIGNKPIDDGNYLFEKEEMEEFIKKEPKSANYFRPWYGSREFINRKPRYCLWLGDCPPNELRKMPECMKRVDAVRAFRLASKSAGTQKLAERPTRFHVENMPEGNYILVPRHSSERRRYIPFGFLSPDCLTGDAALIIPNATLYHFGILESNVHMAWMRTVCGRLKSDYRYSKDIVYNNFPWPDPTPAQKAAIEQTAQAILDARARYTEASLADLYDETTMPPDLRRAHQANDRAVLQSYGFPTRAADFSEADCVAALMKLYQEKVSQPEKEK